MPDTTVLIADDAPTTKRSLGKIIAGMEGFSVIGEASDGEKALTMIHRLEPDILITDIRMPHLDGLGLVERLRKEGREIPVIILSGYAEFEYARRAIQYQVTDYLMKPVVPDEVVRLLTFLRIRLTGTSDEILSTDITVFSPSVRKMIAFIHANLHRGSLSLSETAETVNYSLSHASRVFKNEIGLGFSEYVTRSRLKIAAHLLKHTSLKITEVAEASGYDNYSHFEKVFKKIYGKNPSDYRKK